MSYEDSFRYDFDEYISKNHPRAGHRRVQELEALFRQHKAPGQKPLPPQEDSDPRGIYPVRDESANYLKGSKKVKDKIRKGTRL